MPGLTYAALPTPERVFIRIRTIGGVMGVATARVIEGGQVTGIIVRLGEGVVVRCKPELVEPARDLIRLFRLDQLPARGAETP